MRATRDHLDALVQASPLPIVSLTMGGDVMSWNRAAETVFGWSAEEAVGRRLLCVPPEKQGEFDQVRNTALRSGGFTGYETVRVRRDGSRIDVSISTAPLRDAAGGPTGLVATYLDISDRKRAEEALRQSQEQMRQAQKMEAVGRLAGGVAHDFNNLLSAILSYSEMVIADLPEGHPSRDDADQIRQAGNRAAELTHQLLAFSRRQLLQLRSLNLNTDRRERGPDAAPRHRRGYRAPHRARPGARPRARGCRAAGAGADEPGGQRTRRDAVGGRPLHHDRQLRGGRGAARPSRRSWSREAT